MINLIDRMSRFITFPVFLFLAFLAPVTNADLIGVSLNNTGGVLNEGFGELDPVGLPGVGFGRSTPGDCVFDSVDTTCTLEGIFFEAPDSSFNPFATGTFKLTTAYPGSGPSPLLIRSAVPDGDFPIKVDLGIDTLFTLEVMTLGQLVTVSAIGNDLGGDLAFTFGFNQLGTDGTCTGLNPGQECRIGQVLLTPGSSIHTTADENTLFQFRISEAIVRAQIPAPSSVALVATGMFAFFSFGLFRRTKV